jgi:hypothetical protein
LNYQAPVKVAIRQIGAYSSTAFNAVGQLEKASSIIYGVNNRLTIIYKVAKQTIKVHIKKPKVKRAGVHAKTKNSKLKTSKNYVKSYTQQGR